MAISGESNKTFFVSDLNITEKRTRKKKQKE